MGLYFWNKRSGAALEKAIEYFTHATAIDPQFARAYALLADTYFLQFYLKLVPAAQAVPQSREAAERAIALDPSVAEAHVALATVQSFAGNRIETEKSLRQAI